MSGNLLTFVSLLCMPLALSLELLLDTELLPILYACMRPTRMSLSRPWLFSHALKSRTRKVVLTRPFTSELRFQFLHRALPFLAIIRNPDIVDMIRTLCVLVAEPGRGVAKTITLPTPFPLYISLWILDLLLMFFQTPSSLSESWR